MIAGIDLGTTFSVISKMNKDGSVSVINNVEGDRTTPSVVMFEDGNVIVGKEAKDNSVLDPLNVVQFVKRQMGEKSFEFFVSQTEKYSAEEISALILKKLKQDAEKQTGEKIDAAVITVPAYFTDAQRKATQDAGIIAGLNVLGIINEPTAAALAYCYSNGTTSGNMMVFDIGGGTLDITIMHVSENLKKIDILSTNGNRNLGGFDFDNLIINKVVDYYSDNFDIDIEDDENCLQDLRIKAENAKKTLSTREKVSFIVDCQNKRTKFEITRSEFELLMQQYTDTMAFLMDVAVEEANISYNHLDKVLIVGGSSRIPCIQNMIRDKTGITPSTELNPDEVVSIGATYYAKSLIEHEKDDVDFTDVNSHDLGIEADNIYGKAVMNTIIKKNELLPVSCKKVFYTSVSNQHSILVKVVEGDGDDNLDFCTYVGEAQIQMKYNWPEGSPIEIEMTYDKNGVIHVQASDVTANEFLGEFSIKRKSNLSEEEIIEKKNKIDEMEI